MIFQKKSFAAEPQFLCDECSEAVINPLCPFCLTREIDAWLTLYPNLREEFLPTLKEYLNKITNTLGEYTACIRCKSKTAAVCPYCFTKYVLSELNEIRANTLIVKEFFEFFNFDLHHTGYTKEAERLGLI